MPAGKPNVTGMSKSKRKPEVIDKVREIKQRQQNWLLQREHSKQADTFNSKQRQQSIIRSAPGGSASRSKSSDADLPQSDQLKYDEKSQPQVKNKFNHWMRSRRKASPVDDYDKGDINDSNSVCSGAESELERLVSPEIDNSKYPLPEEEFGNLADEITLRVKHDLGISQGTSALSSDFNSDHLHLEDSAEDESIWKSSRCKTYTQEAPSFNHLGTSGLTSHSCIVCNKLMLSSNHIPMMVIPCGHTLCKACSEGRKLCPACKCSVMSLTLNVMLQQVIQEYHSYPVPSTTTLIASSHDNRENIAFSNDTSKNERMSSFVEDKRRNCNASYQNQFVTLQTRHEVLSKEYKTLLASQDKVKKKISHGTTQLKNITGQEDEVKKAIENLQERYTALQEHRKQYESQVRDLNDEKSEVEAKITLLSGTLSSLLRELEKVKLLAEGERD